MKTTDLNVTFRNPFVILERFARGAGTKTARRESKG